MLVPMYRAGLAVKEALRGEPKRLQWPVVSVGSLSAGGAGKTPVVIALAKLLKERGWNVDVLSRGYGRNGRGVEQVAAQGEKQVPRDAQDDKLPGDAERFGDEPVMIARAAGVPVWVGAERFAAGLAAEQESKQQRTQRPQRETQRPQHETQMPQHETQMPQRETQMPQRGNAMDATEDRAESRGLHLLDDGFQHRKLARTVDVVLVTAEDLGDALLPAGNLREPWSALARADVVVVREEELKVVRDAVWARMREGAQMWLVRRRLRFPAPMKTLGAGLRPMAFCAIARPEGFASMLLDAGCGVVETVLYDDHHRYSLADIEYVLKVAKGLNASGLVTTEKDAVKLTAAMRARLETLGPLMVVGLEAEFVDAAAVVQALEARLA
jgi:tetraacyldisaccharide 4'-kinase